LAATTSSLEASGSPFASRATPGAWVTCSVLSRSSTDVTSADEPPRITIAVSGRPVARSVWL